MKITCNLCYAEEIEIHNYNGVLYADPCSCIIKKQEEDLLYDVNTAHEDGWNDGYQEGRLDMKMDVAEGIEDIPEYNTVIKRRFINKLNKFMDKI